jgi:hypothetical protein
MTISLVQLMPAAQWMAGDANTRQFGISSTHTFWWIGGTVWWEAIGYGASSSHGGKKLALKLIDANDDLGNFSHLTGAG